MLHTQTGTSFTVDIRYGVSLPLMLELTTFSTLHYDSILMTSVITKVTMLDLARDQSAPVNSTHKYSPTNHILGGPAASVGFTQQTLVKI